ncbi:cytosolic phospholipase A2 gamma-like, partial [Arapaima gigas]
MPKDDWLALKPEDREEYVEDLSFQISNSLERLRLGGITKIIVKTLEALHRWDWGTRFNFLYKYPVAGSPVELLSEEKRQLEDAGLLLNSPYVAALRPARKVDLIVSFDFSSGDPFL